MVSAPTPASRLYTPEIARISARCRPNTFSSAPEISPTVAFARAASIDSARRLPPAFAPFVSASSARVGIFDLQNVNRRLVGEPVFVNPDHRLLAGIDARLLLRRGLFDAQFRNAGFDRLRHA